MNNKSTEKIVVFKFGGTSLAAKSGFNTLRTVVNTSLESGETPVLIISALENITDELARTAELAAAGDDTYLDRLLQIAKQHRQVWTTEVGDFDLKENEYQIDNLIDELKNILHGVFLVRDISPRTEDSILSYGEILSSQIVYFFLRKHFSPVRLLDSRQLIITDKTFGRAHVQLEPTQAAIRLNRPISGEILVAAGFIGRTESGEPSTLGRGGSDYTASLFAAALGASEIQFWTKVSGIMTADPSKISKALTISRLSYEEAMELCHFGAKVIDPRAMQPAMDHGIPIYIKNSFLPDHPGSLISCNTSPTDYAVTGIASISSISMLRLQGTGMLGVAGTSKRLFDALWRQQISVILITQASSEHSICFAVSPEHSESARLAVNEEFRFEIQNHSIEPVLLEADHSVIAVVGANMRQKPGISGRLFQALGKNGINVRAIAQGSSELNISVVIRREDEAKALGALHDTFFLSDCKTVSLFVAGTGQVGSKLLEQLSLHCGHLQKRHLEIRLVGIANSRQMLFDSQGIEFNDWQERLHKEGEKMSLPVYLSRLDELNLPNSVFVDCSASEAVAACYGDILEKSVSIVTPNKKANSGAFAQYLELRNKAAHGNVKFFYETNVGAGLPVISTLNDLLNSGDEVIKIEAVLSGTLSYIFNTFSPDKPFSAVVQEAKALGYTEPDPRDDLSGLDVARKLLILAREMGAKLELEDIEIEPLYPDSCAMAASVDEFFAELRKEDKAFEKRAQEAAACGRRLRYIATLESGRAKVSLQTVGPEHPFFSIAGSDNIISFTTNRYNTCPLVVKGPGAGTEVTAAGVFADIVRTASYLS